MPIATRTLYITNIVTIYMYLAIHIETRGHSIRAHT
jgi:hypothetical protein